jgi:hypothetical protein
MQEALLATDAAVALEHVAARVERPIDLEAHVATMTAAREDLLLAHASDHATPGALL